ncbi:hypothetical protein C2E23DRAFT_819246 [Lenzites betulinus]|nr:hypothetical protein C2E23DRAFT_819246 [Lenzites betulinus]
MLGTCEGGHARARFHCGGALPLMCAAHVRAPEARHALVARERASARVCPRLRWNSSYCLDPGGLRGGCRRAPLRHGRAPGRRRRQSPLATSNHRQCNLPTSAHGPTRGGEIDFAEIEQRARLLLCQLAPPGPTDDNRDGHRARSGWRPLWVRVRRKSIGLPLTYVARRAYCCTDGPVFRRVCTDEAACEYLGKWGDLSSGRAWRMTSYHVGDGKTSACAPRKTVLVRRCFLFSASAGLVRTTMSDGHRRIRHQQLYMHAEKWCLSKSNVCTHTIAHEGAGIYVRIMSARGLA